MRAGSMPSVWGRNWMFMAAVMLGWQGAILIFLRPGSWTMSREARGDDLWRQISG